MKPTIYPIGQSEPPTTFPQEPPKQFEFKTGNLKPSPSFEYFTVLDIARNSGYQLGFWVSLRAYGRKRKAPYDPFAAAKIQTLLNTLRTILAGCPGFSRDVAVWIKKGIRDSNS